MGKRNESINIHLNRSVVAFSSINRHFVVNFRKKGENKIRIFYFPFHRTTFELRRASTKSAFYYSVTNKRELSFSYTLFFTQQKIFRSFFLFPPSEHFFECVLRSHENSSQNKSVAKKKRNSTSDVTKTAKKL